jgi:hypothetical protein
MRKTIFSLMVCVPLISSAADIKLNGATDNPKATPVLWRDPGNIPAKDLYWGSGSPSEAPQPPFSFVKEDTGGTKPKVHITDARGVAWSVKFSGDSPSQNEVHAEIAAARLMWALGYEVDESYYVPEGRIEGATGLRRAAKAIGPEGSFRTARFEKRPAHIVRTGKRWSFDRNPFLGSKELSGLRIHTTLLANWDATPRNTDVLQVKLPDGSLEERYIIADLGSTFGKIGYPGSLLSPHNRWNAEDYREQKLIDWARKDVVRLNYDGGAAIRDVPVEDARWFAQHAGQLTSEQVRQAFKASGAADAEIDAFSTAFMGKIAELQTTLSGVE